MSRTFTVTGRSSSFSEVVHPPLLLDTERYEYTIALRSFVSYNSIPNVEKGVNSRIHVVPRTNSTTPSPIAKTFDLPDGSYEIEHLEAAIREKLQSLIDSDGEEEGKKVRAILKPHLSKYEATSESIFSLKPDNSTLKCRMKSELFDIDFTASDSLADMLGFSHRIYPAAEMHESEHTVDIIRTLAFRIETNL